MKRTLLALLAAAAWSCGTSNPTPGTDAGDTDISEDATDTEGSDTEDPDTRTDIAEEDTAPDTVEEDTAPAVALVALSAPDEYSVELVISDVAGAAWLAEPTNYMIVTERERLGVQSITVTDDGDDARVTLHTLQQRLGLTYSIEIYGDERAPYLTGDFVAADTARFWIYDWADGGGTGQLEIVADRVALGETSVAYLMQGQRLDIAQDIIDGFDADIFPTETGALIDAPDMDDNGRVVILGIPGGGYFGGYFDPVNTMTDSETMATWGYHSNEMELVHLATDYAMGTPMALAVIAHEFQHLLYHERHGFAEHWDYHNEGLAEIAVQMVYGRNDQATEYLLQDYEGRIANGLSMVHWNYAVYDNYVLAYTFWTYVGAQSGDPLAMYQALFNLENGAPNEVDALLQDTFGLSFADMHLDSWLAVWLQEAEGPYSFDGLASFSGEPPTVPRGVESIDLEPFGAAHFVLDADSVVPPETTGEHIRYVGINGAGVVDFEPPYDITDGVLVTYNANADYAGWPAEHSGPDQPALTPRPSPLPVTTMSQAPQRWQNPPPRNPNRPDAWDAWLRARRAALGL